MTLPSRKLRHSNRKASPLSRLLTMGVILFGSIFILFILYELILAQNSDTKEGLHIVQSSQSSVEESGERKEPAASEAVPVSAGVVASPVEKTSTNQQAASTSESVVTTPASPKPTDVKKAPAPQTPTPAAKPASQSAATPSPQQANPMPTTEKTQPVEKSEKPKPKIESIRHVVQKGETLFQLSRKYYGNQSSVRKIAAFNGLSPDNALPIGKVLYIPVSK
ncbi:LysM peptidoglycan-binding domain-containing protein [Brevibacillus fluminis]|uniref:LysM peptidoglycan-binding domain-containing protein n=1 Tax=Brevibacillus fluminis TaxID=511487 RepID=A0A3M8D137_9BACL|nr:LysM domain-containing protein [Brevibacillus fluminis]RNB81598.1 LysM peptidoglycan-binding domain-containing protein [Brevibacillus fluminis]